jgi:hypothetical protein
MGTKEMCTQNGVLLRGKTYYFQARIPEDCRKFFPKAVIREKLLTKDRAKAKAQVRQKWADLEFTIERIRSTGSPHKVVLTEDAIKEILAASIASRLAADEENRTEGVDAEGFQRIAETIAGRDNAERLAASHGDLAGINTAAQDWLINYGYDISASSYLLPLIVVYVTVGADMVESFCGGGYPR